MSFAYRTLTLFLLGSAAACSSDDTRMDIIDPADEAIDEAPRRDASSSARTDASTSVGRRDASPTASDGRGAFDVGSAATDSGVPSSPTEAGGGAAAADAAIADAADSPTVRSTGPGDWGPGDYPKEAGAYLEIKGVSGQKDRARQYRVHVPPKYDRERPTPVVFCIHGLGQNGLMFCGNGTGLLAKADAENFILVMPNGYSNSWNGGTCCGTAATDMLDDVALFRAIFKEISGHLNIDLSRVFATGHSNGGYMSYRLACEAADIFAAVAPSAGAIGMNDIGGGTGRSGDWAACKPAAKISVLDVHGTADALIPYRVQKPTLDRIAMANGCKLTTKEAAQPRSAGDTKCVTYEGCPDGIDVTGCTVMGGGHVWFGNETCGTGSPGACGIVGANSMTMNNTDAAWDFFKAHPRP